MVNEVTINYNVQSEGTVTIAVYNIAGELIKTLTNEYKNAGEHTVKWYANDANNNEVAEGIYFICLTSKDFTKTSKITLIR
ncbi:MAG: T9SS type A sorting domain-containing protein [Bacteroidales bacterium]|nr:T9SS type A sorting domain-containing protein [Bacteroidales bacterium]